VRRNLDAEIGDIDLRDGLDEAADRAPCYECDGRNCWMCSDESWRTEPLPAGVAIVEAE
jgi:hypothetical protein